MWHEGVENAIPALCPSYDEGRKVKPTSFLSLLGEKM